MKGYYDLITRPERVNVRVDGVWILSWWILPSAPGTTEHTVVQIKELHPSVVNDLMRRFPKVDSIPALIESLRDPIR